MIKSQGFMASMKAFMPKKPPCLGPSSLIFGPELVAERGYVPCTRPWVYGLYGKAKRWRMEKMDISMQRSKEGIPTFKSGYAIFAVGETILRVEDVRMLIIHDCQKDRKITSLIAITLRKGL